MYISVKCKFIITSIVVFLFVGVSTIIEVSWWITLSNYFNKIIATLIILGLAFFPGIMISLTISGIFLDSPRRKKIIYDDLEDITILIAAYNEESSIYETLESISRQLYPKNIIVKVIDNNSKDNTKSEILRAIKDFSQLNIEYLFESKQGKYAALNKGLSETTTRFVITLDADTFLYKESLITITNSIIQESKNKKVAAIAGTVLVRNSRENLLTKIQEWEYFLSISGIKRTQGLFQTTLVAQGAFSIYNTKMVQELGGWKNSIGEDIVLTWELLSKGAVTYYCDDAICFTNVPTKYNVFARQRARWARGLIEGLRHFNWKECSNNYTRLFVFLDLFLFVIDTFVTFVYIPGVFIAIFFHNWIIVGPMTLLFFPITLFMFFVMYLSEKCRVFNLYKLKIRKHYFAFVVYCLCYSIFISPVCIWGYIQELGGLKRRWK